AQPTYVLHVASKSQRGCWSLQHNLLSFFQTGEQFGLGAVGNAYGDRDFFSAIFAVGVGYLYGSFAVFVVHYIAFRNRQNALVFFQDDFGVRGHLRLQLTLSVVDRNPDFERGYVVFFHTHGGNFGHLAVEGAVFVGFHFNAGGL